MVSALVLVAAALFAFAAAGVWAARGGVASTDAFPTARDGVGPAALTATVVASSMGAWILFSPPEAGVAFGGVAFFPPARAVLPAGLPPATFLRAFGLAVLVSAATSLLAARLADRRFDLGALAGSARRLDAREGD